MFRANLIARWKPQVLTGKPRLCRGCDGCDGGLGVCVVEAATRGCRFGEDHESVDRRLEHRSAGGGARYGGAARTRGVRKERQRWRRQQRTRRRIA
eukprot:6174958-Pleurochrysis_carterae.AAC.1